MDSNYSLADIRAATHDDDGYGGQGSWFWIVVLFLFMFGFGRNGMWGNGDGSGALTRAEMTDGFNNQSVLNKLDGISNGLCQGFYAQNNTALQGFATMGNQIMQNQFAMKECCCETNRNIDAVRAENYKNTCEITTAIHSEGEATRALIQSNTIQNLRDRLDAKNQELQTANFQLSQQAQNATLINELRPCAKPAYITCSPYQARNFGGGCGCDCFA